MDKKDYAYMLRFRKDVPLNQKALDKIDAFCRMTRMNKRDAMIFMLAATDVDALADRLLSITAGPEPEKAEDMTKKKYRSEDELRGELQEEHIETETGMEPEKSAGESFLDDIFGV